MDMSESAIATRNITTQKRRDINEFYITRRFLFPLAVFGIQSADPAYTTTILSANRFGIKHSNPKVRLASTIILNEVARSLLFNFNNGLLS